MNPFFMGFEIPTDEKTPEEPEETLTEDELTGRISRGDCNDPDISRRIDSVLQSHPELLISEKIEKAVGLRLQDLVVHAKAKDHHAEMLFLDTLFRHIQEARREHQM